MTLGTKHVVSGVPARGPFSQEVWVLGLSAFTSMDRWYVYFAASDGNSKHHQSYVLRVRQRRPVRRRHAALHRADRNPLAVR